MKEALKKIMDRLEEIYPGRNPMIEIFGDGGWIVEADNDRGIGRIGGGGDMGGRSIEELEQKLNIKL